MPFLTYPSSTNMDSNVPRSPFSSNLERTYSFTASSSQTLDSHLYDGRAGLPSIEK